MESDEMPTRLRVFVRYKYREDRSGVIVIMTAVIWDEVWVGDFLNAYIQESKNTKVGGGCLPSVIGLSARVLLLAYRRCDRAWRGTGGISPLLALPGLSGPC
jgi:hypothetical protein